MKIQCSNCDAGQEAKPNKDGSPKLPKRWKSNRGMILCPACLADGFAARVLTLPVVHPLDCGWKDFNKAMYECWRESTYLANLIGGELAKQDTRTKPGEKISKFKPDSKAVYAKCREAMPEFDTGALSALMQLVQSAFLKNRFDVHRGERHGMDFRFPYPYPIRAQNWKPFMTEQGYPAITLRLGSRDADEFRSGRISLGLKGGKEFRYQREAFERMVKGELKWLDLKLSKTGDGKVLARMTVMMPKRSNGTSAGTLYLRTDKDALLVWKIGDNEERPPLHADQVKQWIIGHAARRQRFADDLKFEKRWPKRVREGINAKLDLICQTQNDRLKTFAQQTAAIIAGVCQRNRLGRVEYDDADKSFVEPFPWAMLATAIGQRLSADGIEFAKTETPSAEVKPEAA